MIIILVSTYNVIYKMDTLNFDWMSHNFSHFAWPLWLIASLY